MSASWYWTASLMAQRLKRLPSMPETRFNPWVGKIPWRRKWQSTPVFLPGESHGQRRLVGHSPRGHRELDTTERLHLHQNLIYWTSPTAALEQSLRVLRLFYWYDRLANMTLLWGAFHHHLVPHWWEGSFPVLKNIEHIRRSMCYYWTRS